MSVLARYLLPLIGLTAVILVVGLLPLWQRTRRAAIATELGAHAVGWIIVLAYAAIWIPRYRKIFQDFGFELSSLSMLVIQIADLLAEPLVMLVVSVIVLAADGIIYSWLWKNAAAPKIRNGFSFLMTLLPLSLMVLFGAAIYPTLLKLMLSL
jgi:type II secretory pathway component PulF